MIGRGLAALLIFYDIYAMYPSLNITAISKIVAEEFLETNLEIETDWLELAMYLAVLKDREELETLGLREVTHTRLRKGGQRPGI